ncbi:MAG: VCBS repeat-containing protein [Thermoplasmata archaeon]|nr:MAG: VCBS repeat-containing protein [Thermoplasmata archaeon]
MNKKPAVNRIFVIAIALGVAIVSNSCIVKRNDMNNDMNIEKEQDDVESIDILNDRGTRYYHDREQDSFGSGLFIGTAAGSIYDIAVCDLDNDGDMDIVSCGEIPGVVPPLGEVCIWQNSGTPFESPSTWTSLTISSAHPIPLATAVDVGDLDYDGDLDIVSGHLSDLYNIHIWENPLDSGTGDPWAGPWNSNIVWAVGTYVSSVAFGDLDNDGNLDIVSGGTNGSVAVINVSRNPKNQRGDPWTESWDTNNGGSVGGVGVSEVTVGDLDNDGWLDIASGDWGLGRVYLFENDGTPWDGFIIGPVLTHPLTGVLSVAMGDVNNDGDLDIIFGDDNSTTPGGLGSVRVWDNPRYDGGDPWDASDWSNVNLGQAFVGDSIPSVAIGDLDNDAWLDIIAGDNLMHLASWENDATPLGSWEPHKQLIEVVGGSVNATAVGDLDNDGDLDIITGDGGANVYICNNSLIHRNMPLNSAIWAGDVLVDNIYAVAVGDLDNDGDLDLATGNFVGMTGENIHVWENVEPWNPNWATINGVGKTWVNATVLAIALGDLDNDGDLDIVTGDDWHDLQVWENDGTPFIGGWLSNTLAASHDDRAFRSVALADFDHDGDLDIVSGNDGLGGGGDVDILKNPLNDDMSPQNPFTVLWNRTWVGMTGKYQSKGVTSVGIGDLDNDGDVDIITGDGAHNILIWENLNSSGTNPWDPDVWSDSTGVLVGNMRVSGNGAGVSIEVGDLDNDGDLDIVGGSRDGLGYSKISVYENPLGTTNLWAGNWTNWMIDESLWWEIVDVAIGDMDNDGDIDITTNGNGTFFVNTYINPNLEKSGIIPPKSWSRDQYFLGYEIRALALGDLDNKNATNNNKGGDLDVIAGTMSGVYLFENIGAQTTVSASPVSIPPATHDINNGQSDNLMNIYVTHNGVSKDNDTELAIWRFKFFDNGLPLTSTNITNLIASFYIYNDTNPNGLWDLGDTILDANVITVNGNVVTFDFVESLFDSDVVIPANPEHTTRTYFFVVRLTGDASLHTPNTFNVTFDPDGYNTGDWNEVEHEDEDTILTILEAQPTVAGQFRAVGPVVNTPPEAQYLGVQGFLEATVGIMHISDHTPDLNWTYYDVDGDPQTQYEVRVGTAPGLNDMWAPGTQVDAMTTVTYAGSALIDDTDYWFGVKVYDGTNWSAWNEAQFHMNTVLAPTAPVIPADGTNIPSSLSQTVSWTSGGADPEGDTVTYFWELSENDNSFTPVNIIASGSAIGTISASFATSPSNTYYWRVNATDSWEFSEYGNTPPSYWYFTTSANTVPEVLYLGVQGFLEATPSIMHITDHTPDLNWTYYDADGDPQTQYEVRVGTAPGLNDMWAPGVQVGAITTVMYAGASLIDNADYWFGVKVYDGTDWSAWNETQFHMNTILSPTTPVNPSDGANIPAISTQTVSWTPGGSDPEGDTVTYYWEVSENDDTFAPTSILVSGSITGTVSTSFPTLPSITYYWRVNATDSWEFSDYGNTPPSYWVFTTTANTAPEALYLGVQGYLEATAGIMHITDHTPDLNWTYYDADGDSQTQYEIRVGTTSGLNDMWAPGAQVGDITAITYAGAPLIDNADYWFGVKVYDGTDWSAWNEVQFHINEVLAPGEPVSPVDSSSIPSSLTQIVSWTCVGADPENDIVTYYWEVSEDVNTFAPANIIASGSTTGTTSSSFVTLPSTTYYWRVNATDSWEFSEYGNTPPSYWDFTTTSLPPEIYDINATPSPQIVGGEVTISANITDEDTDLKDLTVIINITKPDGTKLGNFTMTYDPMTGRFMYTSIFDYEGTYTLVIWVTDEEGNWAKKNDTFVMETPIEEPDKEPQEYNWKPIIALIFAVILLILGGLVSYRRPLRYTGILEKDRWYTFLRWVLPFVIAEAIIGIISFFTGLLSVPPIFGLGIIVDLIILISGLICCMVIFDKNSSAMFMEEQAQTLPSPPEEVLPPLEETNEFGKTEEDIEKQENL